MNPPARGHAGPRRAHEPLALHFRLENVLPHAREIEITGRHRAARVNLHRRAADQHRRPIPGVVHRPADAREQAQRGFELGAVGGHGLRE